MNPPKLVILDRDGTINEDRDDYVKSPDEWVPMPGALEAIARLNHAGWHAVIATNQSGLGRGLFDMATLNAMHAKMNQLLAQARRAHRRGVLLPARARARLRLPQAAAGPDSSRSPSATASTLKRRAGGRRHAARPAGRRRGRLPAAPGAHRQGRAGSTRRSSPQLLRAGARHVVHADLARVRRLPDPAPARRHAAQPASIDSGFGGSTDACRRLRRCARRCSCCGWPSP